MARAEAKLPPAENKIIYEKRVPEMSACPRTFIKTSKKYSRVLSKKRAKMMGAFARPSRIKGSGLGIEFSTAAKKKQREPKNKIRAVLSFTLSKTSFGSINFFGFSFFSSLL